MEFHTLLATKGVEVNAPPAGSTYSATTPSRHADTHSILLLTGMDLSSFPSPEFGHRMTHLLEYMEDRGISFTAVFPAKRGGPGTRRIGHGVFIGLPFPSPGASPCKTAARRDQAEAVRLLRSFVSLLGMRREKWDICIVHGATMALMAIAMRHLGRIRFVVYEDLDYLPAFSGAGHSFNKRQVALTESWVVRNSNLVVSVSNELTRLRLRQGAKRVLTVPNGARCSDFAKPGDPYSRKPILLYSGSLSDWSGVNLTLRALPEIRRRVPSARFRVVGDGARADELKSFARATGVAESVDFLGRKRPDELPILYVDCSIGLAVFPKNELMYYSYPLKVPEFLAAGLPVVSTGADGTKEFLESTRSGIIVEENPDSVADACVRLLTDRAMWLEMSGNARTAAKELDWLALFDNEMEHIWNMAGGME